MSAFLARHCDLCGYDVPGFLWVDLESGGHAVVVEGPLTVEREQPRDYFERNLWRIRVSMDVQAMLCRDYEGRKRAGDSGDEGRDRSEPVDARARGEASGGAGSGEPGTG